MVINGLTNDENLDDKAVVTGMIYKEFGRQVTVKHCRRLGRKIEGKAQNLLVSLSSADEASYLISNAKHLRRSSNEFVRKNIYIYKCRSHPSRGEGIVRITMRSSSA